MTGLVLFLSLILLVCSDTSLSQATTQCEGHPGHPPAQVEDPEDQTVALGSIATFICSCSGCQPAEQHWVIHVPGDGDIVYRTNNPSFAEALENRSITFHTNASADDTYILTVLATEENNGIEVGCAFIPCYPSEHAATLTVVAMASNTSAQVEEPENQTVALGSNATFTCSCSVCQLAEQHWTIHVPGDGDIMYRTNNPSFAEALENRNITFHTNPDDTYTLTVLATEENNGIEVGCAFLPCYPSEHAATLTVVGPPPQLSLSAILLGPTEIQLTWETPFTQPGFGVLYYNIEITNLNSSEVHVVHINGTTETYVIGTPDGETVQSCVGMLFNVTAVNSVGTSAPSFVSKSFPVAPGAFLSPMNVVLLFSANGSPMINIQFWPPWICPFQDANYTITVQQLDTNEAPITVGPKNFSYVQGLRIEETITMGLVPSASYQATVIVDTVAGNSSNSSVFSTQLINDGGGESSDKHKHSSDETVVIVTIIAVGVGLLVSGPLLVAVLCFMYRKKKKSQEESTLPETINPAYDPYEQIDGYQASYAQIPPSYLYVQPNPPPRMKTEESNLDFPLDADDNYRLGVKAPSVDQLSNVSGEYTTMNSAGTLTSIQKRGKKPDYFAANGNRYSYH